MRRRPLIVVEALGIQWSVRDATCQRHLASATACQQREGRLHPRKRHRVGNIDLAKWLSTQRAARAGALSGRTDRRTRRHRDALEPANGWIGVQHVTARRRHAQAINPPEHPAPASEEQP